MAERRMFAQSVINSDAFLDLPPTARLLYFDLGMRGDDDGFVDSPRRAMRMIGATDEDLRLLVDKRFLLSFDSGVVAVRHWKVHNQLRADRHRPTLYQREMSLLCEESGVYALDNQLATSCQPSDNQMATKCQPIDNQVSTNCQPTGCVGEDREGKDSTVEERGERACGPAPSHEDIVNLFNGICKSYPRVTRLSDARKKALGARLKQYGIDEFKRLFDLAEASAFLKGHNPRGWTAPFDWLIADANMAKVLEGNYGGKPPQSAPGRFKDYDEEF